MCSRTQAAIDDCVIKIREQDELDVWTVREEECKRESLPDGVVVSVKERWGRFLCHTETVRNLSETTTSKRGRAMSLHTTSHSVRCTRFLNSGQCDCALLVARRRVCVHDDSPSEEARNDRSGWKYWHWR